MAGINVSGTAVDEIVKETIMAQVLDALGDSKALVTAVVKQAMNRKVSASGEVSRYESENCYSLIEILASKSIREHTEKVIREWTKENGHKIELEIKRQITEQYPGLVAAFFQASLQAIGGQLVVSVQVENKKSA